VKIKRLKKLIKYISDDVDVYFMFGINDKYEDKENGESSYFEKKLIFTLKEIKEK
jgi:UDP-N-acetylglucosamine pyrophosphorylase